MNDIKTLNQWLRQLGYEWVEGKEVIFKHELTRIEAENMLVHLEYEGAVTRG